MSSILGVFLIFYLILAIKKIDWALQLIILSLPSYMVRFDFGIPFTLLEAMILICFAVWFISNATRIKSNILESNKFKFKDWFKRKDRRYPFDIEIILLLIISFLAAGFAGFSDSAMGIWKAYFFEPVLVFILIFNIFCKKNVETHCNASLQKILWPLSLSALLISIFAIYQKITGNYLPIEWADSNPFRVTSIFSYPNAVGLFLAPLVLVFEGWLVSVIKNSTPNTEKIQIFKITYISLVVVLSVLAIFFARSEGALIGMVVGFIIFGLFWDKKVRKFTLAFLILATLFISLYPPARNLAKQKITLTDLSGEIRKQQWRETFEMLIDSRLFMGAGLDNYQVSILPYHQYGIFFDFDNDPEFHRHVVWNEEYKKSHWQPVEVYLYPHNILLNFWTELGLAGMLLFVWIIAKFFIIGFKNLGQEKKYLPIGLIGAMTAIVVHGLVDVPYFKNDLAVIFWVLIAMLSIINIMNNEKFKNPARGGQAK